MSTCLFFDAIHSRDTDKRLSQTGILMLCNKAPIIYFIDKQNLVEAYPFEYEFTAMKNSLDII